MRTLNPAAAQVKQNFAKRAISAKHGIASHVQGPREGMRMPNSSSRFSLFRTRRFAPLFAAQALGAFNDNVFRNAALLQPYTSLKCLYASAVA